MHLQCRHMSLKSCRMQKKKQKKKTSIHKNAIIVFKFEIWEPLCFSLSIKCVMVLFYNLKRKKKSRFKEPWFYEYANYNHKRPSFLFIPVTWHCVVCICIPAPDWLVHFMILRHCSVAYPVAGFSFPPFFFLAAIDCATKKKINLHPMCNL